MFMHQGALYLMYLMQSRMKEIRSYLEFNVRLTTHEKTCKQNRSGVCQHMNDNYKLKDLAVVK